MVLLSLRYVMCAVEGLCFQRVVFQLGWLWSLMVMLVGFCCLFRLLLGRAACLRMLLVSVKYGEPIRDV